jgi:hypothetical protein
MTEHPACWDKFVQLRELVLDMPDTLDDEGLKRVAEVLDNPQKKAVYKTPKDPERVGFRDYWVLVQNNRMTSFYSLLVTANELKSFWDWWRKVKQGRLEE